MSELEDLRAWQAKYSEAAKLWESLSAEPGDVLLDAVLIGRFQKADDPRNFSILSVSATDSVDYSRQLGMLHEAILVMENSYGDDEEG